ERKGGKGLRVFGLIQFPEVEKMGGGKGSDLERAGMDGTSREQSVEGKAEGEQFVKEAPRLEHLAHRFDSIGGQMHGKFLGSTFQPEALDEHEQSTHVIEMQMGDEQVIDQVVGESRALEVPADRF